MAGQGRVGFLGLGIMVRGSRTPPARARARVSAQTPSHP